MNLARPARRKPSGVVELGELFRVHRGQVTGCNAVWIAGPEARGLPARFLVPSVTRASEIFASGGDLHETSNLHRVVDLPADLDALTDSERRKVDRFLKWAEELRLRTALLALRNIGCILSPSVEPAAPGYGYGDIIAHLRSALGDQIVDLALATDSPGERPAPAVLMPVWAFEPEGDSEDVLLSSGTLWGADMLFEALRVIDDDNPDPVPAVLERFLRWSRAAGEGRTLTTTRLPGRDASYVLFASAA
jgi:hypothetical protein